MSDRLRPFDKNGTLSKAGTPPPPPLAARNEQASQALALRYDALNQELLEIEKRLKALAPPHSVWHDYNRVCVDDDCGHYRWEMLGLIKYNDKWRLVHAYDADHHDNGFEQIQPLTECPADVRVKAAHVVGELYRKIVASKEEYATRVDEAIKELRELRSEL